MKKLSPGSTQMSSISGACMEDLKAGIDNILSVKPKRARIWYRSDISDLSIDELIEKVKKVKRQSELLSIETSVFEKFLNEKFYPGGSDNSEESSSHIGSQMTTKSQVQSPIPFGSGIHGVVRKSQILTTKQKLHIARYYIMIIKDEIKSSKRTSRNFIDVNVALLETYDETLAEIPLERQEMELEFKNLIKANGSIPFLHKWHKYVAAKITKRESLICSTKLRNNCLIQTIKKKISIKKYRDEVDPVEFYSKWTEKKTLIDEIQSVKKHKSRLRRALVPIERYAYEKKQELDNNVKQGEEFRKKIVRERHSLAYLLNKHRDHEIAKKYEKAINEQLNVLSKNYRVPSMLEYIVLVKDNKEFRELIEKWKQKVRVAEMVYKGNVTKWNNIVHEVRKYKLQI